MAKGVPQTATGLQLFGPFDRRVPKFCGIPRRRLNRLCMRQPASQESTHLIRVAGGQSGAGNRIASQSGPRRIGGYGSIRSGCRCARRGCCRTTHSLRPPCRPFPFGFGTPITDVLGIQRLAIDRTALSRFEFAYRGFFGAGLSPRPVQEGRESAPMPPGWRAPPCS